MKIGAKKPKVAIVCDWLTGAGGAEKVILAVHQMYPEAPIYTSQYRPKKIDWFNEAEVRAGWLNLFPAFLKRLIPFLRQFYFSRLDLSEYDIVISITGAEAKSVKTGPNTKHVSYMHAPTQYYWTLYDQYMDNPGFGIFNPIVRLGLRILVKPLRRADYKVAQRPDVIVANSSYIQGEIKKFYHRDSVVIWPNVDTETIQKIAKQHQVKPNERRGFIIFGRHVSWKRFDLAISASMKIKQPLLVAGYGPDDKRLKRLAGDSKWIEFLPRYNGIEELVEHIVDKKAFIFASVEPFGIAPVEALASGTPVIGLKKGGALDIVEAGKNGCFFEEQTVESLAKAMEEFDSSKFDSREVAKTAEKFSEAEFKHKITQLIDDLWEKQLEKN